MFKKILIQCVITTVLLTLSLTLLHANANELLEYLTQNHNWGVNEEGQNQISDWIGVIRALAFTGVATLLGGALPATLICILGFVAGYIRIHNIDKTKAQHLGETENNLTIIQKFDIISIIMAATSAFLLTFPWTHTVIENNAHHLFTNSILIILTNTCVKRKYIKYIIKNTSIEQPILFKKHKETIKGSPNLISKANVVRFENKIFLVKYSEGTELKHREKIARIQNEMLTPI